jgi:hypothetical protein
VSVVTALTDAVIPVLAVAAAGYVLGRFRDVDVDALGTVVVYILTPALVFDSLATTTLGGGAVARIGAGVLAFTVVMAGLAVVAARLLGVPEPLEGPMVLTSTFPNAGNYGIPLSAFAFGALGRSTAVVYITAQAILMYTFGVYLAARGGAERSSTDAVKDVFRLPLVYAVVAAGLVRGLGLVPPTETAAMETLALVGNAAIPVMLVMLGIQLANAQGGTSIDRVLAPTGLKLVVAPVVAVALVPLLGFASDPAVARTFVLECAMPAAITPLVLVVEFARTDADVSPAEYVSTTVTVTTVLSVLTVAIIVPLLQSGAIV